MLRRAAATDVDLVVAFEADVINEKLYGKPLDRIAATSEIDANDYYLQLATDASSRAARFVGVMMEASI